MMKLIKDKSWNMCKKPKENEKGFRILVKLFLQESKINIEYISTL